MEKNIKDNNIVKKKIKNQNQNNNYLEDNLILKTMIKEYNYFPNTNYFDNNKLIEINIPESQNFEKIFPIFTSFCKNLDNSFSKKIKEKNDINIDLNKEIKKYVKIEIYNNEKELLDFIGDKWKNLEKKIKIHTSIFFHLVNEYIVEKKINDYDKNILFWTILFHDSGKFQKMNKYYNEDYSINVFKDKAHPFKSIIIFIQSIIKNNLLSFNQTKEEKEFINFFENEFTDTLYKSFKKEISSYNYIYYNLTFDNIENIEKFLLNLQLYKENKWIFEISILILFHQSLPNNNKHMNNPLLEEKYITKFFDIRLLELMRIIMVYDSCSHSLFKNSNWVYEINKNIEILKTKLFGKNKK